MILLPVRLVLGISKLSVVAGYRLGRLAGYRRLSVLAVGVGIGLLVAPVPGRELRDRLRRRWEAWSGLAPAPGADLAPLPPPAPAPASPPDPGTGSAS